MRLKRRAGREETSNFLEWILRPNFTEGNKRVQLRAQENKRSSNSIMSHSWSWRIVTKKVSWSLYAGTSTDREILLDITRLGCHQSSRKARQRDAERLVAQQDLTPQRQRIEETQHRRGKSSEPSTTLTRRWSWRQVSTKCPDDEAFRKSTEPMEFSLAAFWSEKRIEETKKKGGRAERGKKGGTEGQIWIPIPVGIEGMGKYH